MRPRVFVCVTVAMAALTGALAAGSRTPSTTTGSADRVPATDYRSAQDGPSFMAQSPSGQTWSVWSYRRGAELDVAISRAVGRTWTAPELVGTAGVDDLDPRLAFLSDGTAILAWWQHTPGSPDRVLVSALGPGATAWTAPTVVSGGPASQPNIFVNGDGLFTVGFLNPDGSVTMLPMTVKTVDPKNPPPPNPDTGTNGPDPIPSLLVTPKH